MQPLKIPKKTKSYKYMPGHELAQSDGMVDVELLEKNNLTRPVSDKPYTIKPRAEKKIYNIYGKAANYIADEMSPTKHPSTGEIYTSKKKFRCETKARGCIEVGNETKIHQRKNIETSREERKRDIKNAIEQLKRR